MKKLVKNGMLCTESGVYEADLLIEGAEPDCPTLRLKW